MILVDSSCWVEFYRPGGDRPVQEAVLNALGTGQAAVCGMVQVEILGYIKGKKEYELVSRDFEALLWLDMGRAEIDAGVQAGRRLRSRGVTVPPSDLLIAGVALANDALLLHSDRHFEQVAARCPDLRQEYVGS